MPTACAITISVQSQYDALPISEDLPPASPNLINLQSSSLSADDGVSTSQRTVEAIIPRYPCSQFWISYKCPIPATSSTTGDDAVHFYYFKLFNSIGGPCHLSWGVGAQDGWRGKTMFALFEGGLDLEGRRVIEKRGLWFPSYNLDEGDGFEIHVHRARARKRIELEYQPGPQDGILSGSFHLTCMGRVKRGERQRMYTYALIDPRDEPYIKFRYRFRSHVEEATSREVDMEHLRVADLGLEPQNVSELTPAASEPRANYMVRRLSMPPRTVLAPNASRSEPSSPIKLVAPTCLESVGAAGVDLGEQKRREPFAKTPSSMGPRISDRSTTPPGSKKRKNGSSQLLKDVVVNALTSRHVK